MVGSSSFFHSGLDLLFHCSSVQLRFLCFIAALSLHLVGMDCRFVVAALLPMPRSFGLVLAFTCWCSSVVCRVRRVCLDGSRTPFPIPYCVRGSGCSFIPFTAEHHALRPPRVALLPARVPTVRRWFHAAPNRFYLPLPATFLDVVAQPHKLFSLRLLFFSVWKSGG